MAVIYCQNNANTTNDNNHNDYCYYSTHDNYNDHHQWKPEVKDKTRTMR